MQIIISLQWQLVHQCPHSHTNNLRVNMNQSHQGFHGQSKETLRQRATLPHTSMQDKRGRIFLTNTLALWAKYNNLTNCINVSPKPNLVKDTQRYGYSVQLNTFLVSRETITLVPVLSCWTVRWVNKQYEFMSVPLPGINPASNSVDVNITVEVWKLQK